MDHLCYLCLMFVTHSLLFVAALWSPEWKGLTSWILFMMLYCDFVTFSFGILGQVWYLTSFVSDPCCLSYFKPCLLVLYFILLMNFKMPTIYEQDKFYVQFS